MTNSIHWAQALQIAIENGWDDEVIADRLHELVEVLDALASLYTSDVFASYVTGHNAHLSGARPVDVIALGDYEEVLKAIDQELAGAFA